jgi:hypothetical protein
MSSRRCAGNPGNAKKTKQKARGERGFKKVLFFSSSAACSCAALGPVRTLRAAGRGVTGARGRGPPARDVRRRRRRGLGRPQKFGKKRCCRGSSYRAGDSAVGGGAERRAVGISHAHQQRQEQAGPCSPCHRAAPALAHTRFRGRKFYLKKKNCFISLRGEPIV